MPKVSVCMPCYNAGKYLSDSLESIIGQTYKDFELIVINDGSTDNSKIILQEFAKKDKRIRLFDNNGNQGTVYSRNRGLSLCDGKYIALADADDIIPQDRLQFEVDYLDHHAEIDCINGQLVKIDESGKKLDPYPKEKAVYTVASPLDIKARLFFGNTCANGSTMFRNEFIKKNNLKYRDYPCMHDYAFWCDFVITGGNIISVSKVMQFWRTLPTSITARTKKNSLLRNKIMDDIHQGYLKGMNVNMKSQYITDYLRFSHEDSEPKLNFMNSYRYWRMLKEILHAGKNLDCYEELIIRCQELWEMRGSKYMRSFWSKVI